MTSKQIRLIRASFSLMGPNADAVDRTFYRRLFELDPSLRDMFPVSLEEQGRKLMQMLAVAIGLLGRPNELVPALQSLARGHAGYGVRDEHYETAGTAMLWTFEQELGPAFTPDVREAWTALYIVAATTMKESGTLELTVNL